MKKILRVLLILCIFAGSSLFFTGCGEDLILVTGVDLYTEEIFVNVNESVDLSYKVYPQNASNKKVTFWSTDENIASVDENGKVTVKSTGEASIVVRSVDGGFEDYCRIVTNIDPEEIEWEVNDKVTKVTTLNSPYSATASMALNQVMKLKINYLINGEESDKVTNKNIKFTSSNTSNIQIINENEGIIKAFNNEIIEGERAFSDITATLETAEGVLSTTCRVYINEYTSLNNLHLNYYNGNDEVLEQRNGTETIFLTSGGNSVEFYAYLTNMANVVKTDYDITLESSSESLFKVENVLYSDDGLHKFTLTPLENEGTGTLYIRTSCSDENGRAIRCNVNVTIQAEIAQIEATATERKEGGTEILLNGEIFSFNVDYFDKFGTRIDGAERDIYFEFEDGVENYITYYGNNQFKVKAVPENPNEMLKITIFVYVENVDTSTRRNYEYEFYLRNSLESLIVSQSPKSGTIPNVGISSITLPVGGRTLVYAYATTYNLNLTEPAKVMLRVEDEDLVRISGGLGEVFEIVANTENQGVTKLIFEATDGLITIQYEVVVYVVATIADIELYADCDSNGNYLENITDSITISEDLVKLYVDIVSSNAEYQLECPSAIGIEVNNGVLQEELVKGKVVRYIELDLSSLSTGQSIRLEVSAERILNSKTITIIKG